MRLVALASLVPLLAGCYTYAPLGTRTPEPNIEVRAQLTDEGTEQLGRLLGPNPVAVEGRVVGSTDQDLTLAVRAVTQRGGVENYWQGERVTLPRSGIATMQRRELSRRRSYLLAGGALAALVAAFIAFDIGGGGEPGDRPPPRPQ